MYYIIVLTDHLVYFVLSIKWIGLSSIKTEPFQATAVPATAIFPCWNTALLEDELPIFFLERLVERKPVEGTLFFLIRSGLSVEPCISDTVMDRHAMICWSTVNNRPSWFIYMHTDCPCAFKYHFYNNTLLCIPLVNTSLRELILKIP